MTHFTQSHSPKTKSTPAGSPGRWQHYLVRARTCFRATTVIDSTAHAISDAAQALEGATDSAAEEACIALRDAERALARARECLAQALEAKKLTPANREPSYGLSSYGSYSTDSTR
ncbi:MAG: hypothetical protein Q8N23_16660 [Archangium sp.]|nr:hypothetical protein [Archangium sp.]MDP3154311.1 hypothetical protein [Archangium sp.]MDP3569725.1 hypothetical protein [Archangium sp.]